MTNLKKLGCIICDVAPTNLNFCVSLPRRRSIIVSLEINPLIYLTAQNYPDKKDVQEDYNKSELFPSVYQL